MLYASNPIELILTNEGQSGSTKAWYARIGDIKPRTPTYKVK